MNDSTQTSRDFTYQTLIGLASGLLTAVVLWTFSSTGGILGKLLSGNLFLTLLIGNILLIASALLLSYRFGHRFRKKYEIGVLAFATIVVIASIWFGRNPPWCIDQDTINSFGFEVKRRGLDTGLAVAPPNIFNVHVFRVEKATPIEVIFTHDNNSWLQQPAYRNCNWEGLVDGKLFKKEDDIHCLFDTITTGNDGKEDMILFTLTQPSCKNGFSEAITLTYSE